MNVHDQGDGLDGKQLARIRTHLEKRYIEPGKIAGFLPLVHRRGRTRYCEPIGLMDLERGKPMREDTIFRIYSMTKPITSIALMMLFEEGHFQLNDPVHRWIPEWRDLRVFRSGSYPNFLTDPCERPMRIKDLLTHMSGLTYDFVHTTNVDSAYRKAGVRMDVPGRTLADMIGALSTLPLEFSPGKAWSYSFATDVCGHLIECMSGQRLDAFLKARIFDPLGMIDTGFWVPEEKHERFAANYERGPDKRLRLIDDPLDSPFGREKTFLSGGGGLVSTAHDYLQFCRMLLGQGSFEGRRLIGRKTLELMTVNHLPNGDDLTRWARGSFSEVAYEGVGFGLGFAVHLGPERSATIGSKGEISWGGAASTLFWVDPAEDLVVILLTQLMPSGTFDLRSQMKALVYPSILPER